MVGKQLHGTSLRYTTKEVMSLENKVEKHATALFTIQELLRPCISLILHNQGLKCCLEHAASVAKTFITPYAVVYIKSPSKHLLQTQWLVQVGEQHCFYYYQSQSSGNRMLQSGTWSFILRQLV